MSTEQKTERTRRTREFFDGVRCAPSLNPPLEPDAVTGSGSDNIGTGVRNYLIYKRTKKGCGGFPKGEGNSINVFQFFSAGGLQYFFGLRLGVLSCVERLAEQSSGISGLRKADSLKRWNQIYYNQQYKEEKI
jgi:hypothetical protein